MSPGSWRQEGQTAQPSHLPDTLSFHPDLQGGPSEGTADRVTSLNSPGTIQPLATDHNEVPNTGSSYGAITGQDWEIGIDIYTLTRKRQIPSKNLLSKQINKIQK